jgi:hypothetical protein
MKLRPRLDALEAKVIAGTPDLVICATVEEAQAVKKPATVIITGVQRRTLETKP